MAKVALPEPPDTSPRILSLDIETFPILGYVWTVYDANVLRVVESTSIACFSAKWLDGKQVTLSLPDYPGYRAGSRDDRKLMRDLWTLLDQADHVIAHNARKFDVPKINARFTHHGLQPPSPYRVIDTLREAKQIAAYDSNKLNDLGRFHDLGEKLHTGGFDLWMCCMDGDPSAWRKMKRYNAQDVVLLEKLYLILRPWMTAHPNAGAFSGIACCPKCGSAKFQSRGVQRTVTRSYERFQCQSCGGWFRGTERIDNRASCVNIPR